MSQRPLHRWILMIAVFGLFFASSASAGESRWYLAGKVGQARVTADFGQPFTGWSVRDEDRAASIEVGYMIFPYLAVEGGYHDLGRHSGNTQPCRDEVCPLAQTIPLIFAPVEAEITGRSLSAVPRWPVTDRFSLYGKVGVIDWDADLSPRFFGERQGFSGGDLLAGVGAQYVFAKGFGVLVEYEDAEFIESASLGASWRF